MLSYIPKVGACVGVCGKDKSFLVFFKPFFPVRFLANSNTFKKIAHPEILAESLFNRGTLRIFAKAESGYLCTTLKM